MPYEPLCKTAKNGHATFAFLNGFAFMEYKYFFRTSSA